MKMADFGDLFGRKVLLVLIDLRSGFVLLASRFALGGTCAGAGCCASKFGLSERRQQTAQQEREKLRMNEARNYFSSRNELLN